MSRVAKKGFGDGRDMDLAARPLPCNVVLNSIGLYENGILIGEDLRAARLVQFKSWDMSRCPRVACRPRQQGGQGCLPSMLSIASGDRLNSAGEMEARDEVDCNRRQHFL
jgi:hypothetical protein